MIDFVFRNLIGNAIKFTKESGEIKISTQNNKDFVEVSIADTGIGIADDDRSRIFEDFVTLDTSYSRSAGGTVAASAGARPEIHRWSTPSGTSSRTSANA